jgi:hypothetical protein
VKGRGRGLIYDIIATYARSDCEQPRKPQPSRSVGRDMKPVPTEHNADVRTIQLQCIVLNRLYYEQKYSVFCASLMGILRIKLES